MSDAPSPKAQDAMRDMLAAMSEAQFDKTSFHARIPRSVLRAMVAGTIDLSSEALQRLGKVLLVGKVFEKETENANGAAKTNPDP
jgi:hypothetical protein